MFITHCQIFDFSQLNMYGFFPKKSEFITTELELVKFNVFTTDLGLL